MCPSVTHIEESKPIIWDPPETCNPWAFPSENEKTSAWTVLWVCLTPRVGITQYGSSWTVWLSRPTSYPYPPPTESDSMPSSTYHTLFIITISWRPSSSTEDRSLLLTFRSNYMSVWAPTSSDAQPVTLRLMDRQSESIKSSKICSVLVFWWMVQNGTNTCH
jgi:hypothetical protein